MAYIKAYSDENRRHPDLWGTLITDEQVMKFYQQLCQRFGLKQIPVVFKKRGGAHFKGDINSFTELAFTPGKTSLLLLAHEFAHYLTYWERTQEYNQLAEKLRLAVTKHSTLKSQAERDANHAQQRVFLERRTKVASRSSHSKDFAANVDLICAYIREQGWFKEAALVQQNHVQEIRASASASVSAKTEPTYEAPWYKKVDLVKSVFDALPEFLYCRKCHRDVMKEDVGVRVTSRSIDGYPTRVIRQSYCRKCRSK